MSSKESVFGDKNKESRPCRLRDIKVDDKFWSEEMELVRLEVLPYQWDILNDRVKDAAPSFCMRNFKIAGKQNELRNQEGNSFGEPKYTFRGFEALPEDMNHLEDKFYGFVFQDSDFSKWIEAVAYSLTNHPDPELEKTADEAIDVVCKAQQENGYLDTYYIINGMDKIFTNLRDHHELYCFGHLTEGAVAYYEATGKDKLLNAAKRFADYLASYFGPEEGECKGYPGHEIAEMALVRLYEATQDKKYLNLAKFFVDERGHRYTVPRLYYWDGEEHEQKVPNSDEERYQYNQAHRPVRDQDEAVGHAVRAMYLYSGMADVARLTGDEKLWQACLNLFDSTVNQKMYITGGVGGTHIGEAFSFPYDLPNDTAYAETCASIGLMFFARRMLEIQADSKFSDAMELALYNTVLSGMALDGKSFFYVNPLEVNPKACHEDERKFHVKPVRQKWFGCACCPPNLARLISSLPEYAYTENEDTLFIHLYIGGTVSKMIGKQKVNIHVKSDMPQNGKVSIGVETDYSEDSKTNNSVKMTIAVRMPGWCKDKETVFGEMIKNAGSKICTEKNGYIYISGEWENGEILYIDFLMDIMVMAADTRVREDIFKAAVMRGPVVYCLESVDNGEELHKIIINTGGKITEDRIQIEDQEFISLLADGWRVKDRDVSEDESKDNGLYHKYTDPQMEQTKLKLIPYFTWANRGENEMSVWINTKI